jgi:hypothetical protein
LDVEIAEGSLNRRNSLLISLLARNLGRRPVRTRLPHQPVPRNAAISGAATEALSLVPQQKP